MGRVVTPLKIINHTDQELADRGIILQAQVRMVVLEGLVDTGAAMLALPEDAVRALGLPFAGTRRVRDALGIVAALPRIRGVRLEILGRDMTSDALVLPEGRPALIGQMQLEALDLVIDSRSRELKVNPASPDGPLFDLLAVA